jgi:pyrimidine deaminase RibD-like protein
MSSDVELMQEAVRLAQQCKPKETRIPKVGAVIALRGVIIGRGQRGTGEDGDDDHAEYRALGSVADPSQLPEATLFTTLEPCTTDVRSRGENCCSELVLQRKIKKVFIGILDPNQGVTGKGLWRLQDQNVEVELFPHALAQQIRSDNADFIKSQQLLGAKIVNPTDGAMLETSKSRGRHPIRVKCLNPPTSNTYLFTSRDGLYWPQPGPFKPADKNEWEIDAFFGGTTEHSVHIVTANELGQVLIEYYRKVLRWNLERRERIKKKYNPTNEVLSELLGGDYFGITMTGFPKGLRSEDSIRVVIS